MRIVLMTANFAPRSGSHPTRTVHLTKYLHRLGHEVEAWKVLAPEFRDVVVGRVLEADCSQASFGEDQGVAGVRVYLEDGRYAVSDESGRFHFEGLKPGTHVAKLDTFTVPEWFDVVGCSDDPAWADADSRGLLRAVIELARARGWRWPVRRPIPDAMLRARLAERQFDILHIQTPFVAHYAGLRLADAPASQRAGRMVLGTLETEARSGATAVVEVGTEGESVLEVAVAGDHARVGEVDEAAVPLADVRIAGSIDDALAAVGGVSSRTGWGRGGISSGSNPTAS